MSAYEHLDRERIVMLLDTWIALLGAEINRQAARDQAAAAVSPAPAHRETVHSDWRSSTKARAA